MLMLPPEPGQVHEGRVPMEHVLGKLDVSEVTVFDVVEYMTTHGIPLGARITADTFHDRPFLLLVWETS